MLRKTLQKMLRTILHCTLQSVVVHVASQVVPTNWLFLQSILISEAVKFTPTRNADAYLKLPAGVYFFYDFSPIKVIFTKENASLLHLLLLLEVFLLSPESLMLLSTMGMAQSRRRWNLESTHDSTLD
ncbi:hypothetical protein ZIOFF_064636 [Zingiber officinale]|uniref:Endoplasmic reticulum vesicle transporter C-terminal domain-containing protein n=1 Tax=Zingiber officinale TaxID=94328 RepID=A0A8J5EX46_ZINOF|nr:hypothetical protein ZIOFF_064636 [Zingiber officinale]